MPEAEDTREKWMRFALSIGAAMLTVGVAWGVLTSSASSRFAEIERRQADDETTIKVAAGETKLVQIELGRVEQKLDDIREAIRAK